MPFITQGKTNWKFVAIVIVLAVIVGGGVLVWIKIQKVLPIDEKYCKQNEDCIGTCNWDCINKYYLPKRYTCQLIPACWCINNQCIHIPNREGHRGMLQIIFSPKVMLGKTPDETKEKIIQFINSTNLEIDIIGDIGDGNIIHSITIYREDIDEDLIEKIRSDPLVREFKEWVHLPETPYHKAGLTYLIEFKENLYREELKEFVTKYPKIKDNLVRDYWDYSTYPLQPISVTVVVPVGKENKYITELKTKYQDEILEIEWLPYE